MAFSPNTPGKQMFDIFNYQDLCVLTDVFLDSLTGFSSTIVILT